MESKKLLVCLLFLLPALALPAFGQCGDLNGRVHPNARECVTFSSAGTDGTKNIVPSFQIGIAGAQGFTLPIMLYLPESTGNQRCPFDYFVQMAAPSGYKFKGWNIQGPISYRSVGPSGLPDYQCAVNVVVFRFKGPGSVTAIYDRVAPPPPPPVTGVTGRFLGQDGSDCVGPRGQQLPNGVADLHIRLQGINKPLQRVVVTGDGAAHWETPFNGGNSGVCVVRQGTIADLYFEPPPSSRYSVTLVYTDGTTQMIPVQ